MLDRIVSQQVRSSAHNKGTVSQKYTRRSQAKANGDLVSHFCKQDESVDIFKGAEICIRIIETFLVTDLFFT